MSNRKSQCWLGCFPNWQSLRRLNPEVPVMIATRVRTFGCYFVEAKDGSFSTQYGIDCCKWDAKAKAIQEYKNTTTEEG